MEKPRAYIIKARYFDGGKHQTEETLLHQVTLETAWKVASGRATTLDKLYGDSHFWTVDVESPEGGSYVQLFHGRLV